MPNVSTIVFLLFFSFVGYAQSSESLFQIRKKITLEPTSESVQEITQGASPINPFHRYHFKLEGEDSYRSVGAFGKNLGPHLENNEEALTHLERFRNKRMIATTAGLTALANFALFIGANATKSTAQAREGVIVYKGGFGVGIGAVLVSLLSSALSNRNLETAIELYNLGSRKASQSRFLPTLGVGFASPTHTAKDTYPTLDLAFKL